MLENRMILEYENDYKADEEDYYEKLAIRDDLLYESKLNEELDRNGGI